MKKAILTLAVIAVCTAASSQPLTPQETLYENSIQVNGTAEREVVPDEIYVRIIIDENDSKGKVSVDKTEQDMISALRHLGIDIEQDLRVGDMSSSLYQKTFGRNTFRTTATYQLKVATAEMLGNVYQALGNLGISNLDITRVAHSRIREITNELRTEAVKDAQQVARTMAEAIGQQIGRAVYIVDYNQPAPRLDQVVTTKMYGMAGAISDASLDFRTIKLNYSVTVKFALE